MKSNILLRGFQNNTEKLDSLETWWIGFKTQKYLKTKQNKVSEDEKLAELSMIAVKRFALGSKIHTYLYQDEGCMRTSLRSNVKHT